MEDRSQAEDLIRELGETVRNYDSSDPLEDLVRATPPQLLRAPIGEWEFMDHDFQKRWVASNTQGYSTEDLFLDCDRSIEARSAYLTEYLREAVVDTDAFTQDDRDAVRSLASEGPRTGMKGFVSMRSGRAQLQMRPCKATGMRTSL